MEKIGATTVEKSINNKEKKCIIISVPKAIYEKEDPVDLDWEMLRRVKREFPHLNFLDKLLETEESGENINLLYYYK